MAHSFQVKFTSAFLKQVFQTFAKQIHNHHMVLLSIISLFIAYIVETWDAGFATQFVNKFALPEKHDVLLRLLSFFLKLRVND